MAEEKDFNTVREELTEATKEIKNLMDTQSNDIKQYGETTAQTAAEMKKAEERIEQLSEEKKGLLERLEKVEVKQNRMPYDGNGGDRVLMTPGMQFVSSGEYKGARENGRVTTQFVDVGNLFGRKSVERKDVTGDSQPDSPVDPQRVPEIFYDPGQREMQLLDVMNVAPTGSNTIEFVMETTFDEDGATSQDGEGSAKTKGDMAFELKDVSVKTIAHWVAASRQVLDDSAMLQSHIDGRLTYSVMKELERQLIFGDGTSGEMTGIWHTDGVNTVGAPGDIESGDTVLDHIRRTFAQIRSDEYPPTGIVVNPLDWADIELEKGDDDHYIWVNVPNGGTQQLWRVPVIESTVMDEGRFLAGAFGLGAQVWDRQNAQIRVSEHHSDFFSKNLVAILAELRMALTVYRPSAFRRGTLTADATT